MAWDRCLEDLMPDTCVVFGIAELSTAPSFYGITEWSTAGSTYVCRYRSKRDEYRLVDGGHITQTGVLVIASTSATISPEAKIVLPDGTAPAILSVEAPTDHDGQHHIRVSFGYRQGN